VPGAKELAARVAADPDFILGNHSQNHLDFATLSLSKAATEMDRTAEAVTAAGEPMHWFRFPFGSSTCATMNLVKQRGWTAVGWHIDSADWCYAAGGGVCKKSTFKYVPDSQRSNMLGYIMSQVASTGGGVILFHDIHANTANNLDSARSRASTVSRRSSSAMCAAPTRSARSPRTARPVTAALRASAPSRATARARTPMAKRPRSASPTLPRRTRACASRSRTRSTTAARYYRTPRAATRTASSARAALLPLARTSARRGELVVCAA
jgi:hypothetical protein